MILLLFACAGDFEPRSLAPYPNPFGPDDPLWSPQPHRAKPREVVSRGGLAWVTLPGHVDEPDDRVAEVDLDSGEVRFIEVGSHPTGLALHPTEDWALVLNRFSNYASILEPGRRRSTPIPTDFYASEAVFSPDGGEVWVTNRWRDAVQVWTLRDRELLDWAELPTGANPGDIAMRDDGRLVAVANQTGLDVSLFDRESRQELARVDLRAPPNGLAWVGEWLVVATLSASTHNLPLEGPDGDLDGHPGDGTPNVNFQDLQSEIAVIGSDGQLAHRYTSDTLCCKDFRDVHPEDSALHGELLPSEETWIVGGALPEQVLYDGEAVWVSYASSDEIQSFTLDPATGALQPGPVLETGHGPHGLASDGAGGVLVVERLGETMGRYVGGERTRTYEVGDLEGGAFPATDAEIGELFNTVTAPFTVDGDQSCVQCHREGGNLDKAVGMPLAKYPGVNRRMVMAYRGAFDTRPWFFEGAMDETNFRPVINEFARVENFCCEDYTLWPDGAPADCDTHPPPECDGLNTGSLDAFNASADAAFRSPRPTPYPTRDQFFLAAAERVIGRTTTFGDALYSEDLLTGARTPLRLNLEGITRALGLFLLSRPGLLPNPNDGTAASIRGAALFSSPTTACAGCHPAPTFTVSTHNNPQGLPLLIPSVVSPDRDALGRNVDLLSEGFIATFPTAIQDSCADVCGEALCAEDPAVCDDLRDLYLSPPSLRGLWDRAPSMLHDGRARGLREVLCTPGHPALGPGETGYNERDGVFDSHGATSHLGAEALEDLIAYLETL